MAKLYRFFEPETDITGLPMVALVSGFTDSGSTISQLSEHLFANLDSELVLRFENDQFLDYRSRRPTLFFEKDHIQNYQPAVLGIFLVKDETGQPFLLLDGYEPDLKWDAFVSSVVEFCLDNEVSSFTWVHSIPFPIPHTRPTGITVSGNRQDMIEKYSEWKPQTQVPANIVHLLEYRLSEAEVSSCGFVLLVPHYLADNEVPKAAIRGLELISAATGLLFPSDDIRDRSDAFENKVESQVSENPELAKLIATLEQGYASGESGPARAPIGAPRQSQPNADEIAQELENYLSAIRRSSDPEE